MIAIEQGSRWRIWVQRHTLLACFILAFSISWLIELPVVLSRVGLAWLPYDLPAVLIYTSPGVPLGPAGAAFLLTALLEGKAGVLRLLKRYIQWRVAFIWYLLILLGSPLLMTLTASFFYTPHLEKTLPFISSYLLSLLIAFVINGEEGGWRGFALPRLQMRFGPFWASMILGLLWGIWHLPLMFIPTQSPLGGHELTLTLFTLFMVQIIAKSLSYTWLFNHTGGSILLATLYHAALNGYQAAALFGPVDRVEYELIRVIYFGGLALLLLLCTRGKLGYTPYEKE